MSAQATTWMNTVVLRRSGKSTLDAKHECNGHELNRHKHVEDVGLVVTGELGGLFEKDQSESVLMENGGKKSDWASCGFLYFARPPITELHLP